MMTPRGSGEALILIDYSPEMDLLWVIALDSSGEIWTYPNPKVRAIENISLGRIFDAKIRNGPSISAPHQPRWAIKSCTGLKKQKTRR